jgi:hypothetical protein
MTSSRGCVAVSCDGPGEGIRRSNHGTHNVNSPRPCHVTILSQKHTVCWVICQHSWSETWWRQLQ